MGTILKNGKNMLKILDRRRPEMNWAYRMISYFTRIGILQIKIKNKKKSNYNFRFTRLIKPLHVLRLTNIKRRVRK